MVCDNILTNVDYCHVPFSAMDHKFEFINLDNGVGFLKWKEHILLNIEILDLHRALYEEVPKVPFDDSPEEMEKYDHKTKEWERSNRFSRFIMKYTMSTDIKNAIPDSVDAKEYLASIEKHFKNGI